MAEKGESYVEPEKCANPGCEATYRPHKWGSIKSGSEGWFHQKDGASWCPKHVPLWVEGWRARRGG